MFLSQLFPKRSESVACHCMCRPIDHRQQMTDSLGIFVACERVNEYNMYEKDIKQYD